MDGKTRKISKFTYPVLRLIDWLIDSLIGWLIDWLTHWLVDWLIDWLIDWLVDWLIGWLIDWLSLGGAVLSRAGARSDPGAEAGESGASGGGPDEEGLDRRGKETGCGGGGRHHHRLPCEQSRSRPGTGGPSGACFRGHHPAEAGGVWKDGQCEAAAQRVWDGRSPASAAPSDPAELLRRACWNWNGIFFSNFPCEFFKLSNFSIENSNRNFESKIYSRFFPNFIKKIKIFHGLVELGWNSDQRGHL